MKVRRFGDYGLLVEAGDLDHVVALHSGLSEFMKQGHADFIAELVPAATTVLVTTHQAHVDPRTLEVLLAPAVACGDAHHQREVSSVIIDVDYTQGLDLSSCGEAVGMNPEELIKWHTSTDWVAAFGGFAPGFMYLTPHASPHKLRFPRRSSPRTAVPAGAVALADTFSAVYPRQSPGGWQIIGHTSATLWDMTKATPSLINPGDIVRFREVIEDV